MNNISKELRKIVEHYGAFTYPYTVEFGKFEDCVAGITSGAVKMVQAPKNSYSKDFTMRGILGYAFVKRLELQSSDEILITLSPYVSSLASFLRQNGITPLSHNIEISDLKEVENSAGFKYTVNCKFRE